jgi:hypothetical protein
MNKSGFLNWRVFSRLIAGVAGLFCSVSAFAETFLVKDGQPQAEIVISEKPTRMAKLAAEELQAYVEKMTGARLPITNAPGKDVSAQVYVGKSAYTDGMKITDAGLKSGAFRMVSGKNYLVLLGDDTDFVIKGPFHSGGAMTTNSVPLREWDQRTGRKWGFPTSMLVREHNKELNIWEQDERGSFNAVCEFLRMQGVRWYMPTELGEICPKKATLAIPAVDKTVRPDFRLRHPYQYGHMFGNTTRDEVMWQLRLGIYNGPDPILGGVHGQRNVLSRPEMKTAHPEYYGLYGEKRDSGQRACLSSEGMFQETVDYTRAMFDIYDATVVSVMPEDGYVTLCQCDLCKGKGSPERDWTGQLSDYVWDFVNRVAKEVYKTHPDRKVTCAAYGAFLLPPQKIEKLSPNVAVGICQWRSDFQDPVVRAQFLKLRNDWLKFLPPGGQLVIADYYLHGRPKLVWEGIPVFFPQLIAQDLKSLKGISCGEFIEVYRRKGIEEMPSLAILHLNLYVTSRFWWDADQDLKAMLEEYYTLFYGPARDEMKAFIEYCEANWNGMRKSVDKIDKVYELLGKATEKVPADSVYGKRMALITEFVKPLKDLRAIVAEGRKNAPLAKGVTRDLKDLRLDGKLDESIWEGAPAYELKDLVTGKPVVSPGSFKVVWANDSIIFGITCLADMKNLNIGTTRNEDPNIWNGECVEILLESQTHAYYQLAISPSGAMMDLDRKRGTESIWSSGATVAAFRGDTYWSVEVRLPVVGMQQEDIDPLNGVAGAKPVAEAPWFFNVCRQGGGEKGKEASAFSPTEVPRFHIPRKFGRLEIE